MIATIFGQAWRVGLLLAGVWCLVGIRGARAGVTDPASVTFTSPSDPVICYEFREITIQVAKPATANPFTDVAVTGEFALAGEKPVAIEGFCDSEDGSTFRIRFMPTKPGDYTYSVTWGEGVSKIKETGTFKAVDGHRRGMVGVDKEHPWHFVWQGTGEHYYLNGTTAFLLLGWDDEKVIRDSIDRLHGLEINRLRVLLNGRSDHFWTEPVKPGNGFQAILNPWKAEHPNDVVNPGFDYTRFNPAYWQKFERMLAYARGKDMTISVIFGWNDTKAHPDANSEAERRYFRYAVARLAAFSNVTWDLGDDLDSFRDEKWTHEMGMRLHEWDVYHHLATSHPVNNDHQDRGAEWFSMTSFQQWPRPMHQWMLEARAIQAKTGRIIPQVNEEYGYEDHYPTWAPYKKPAASADNDRRVAWEMAMAGCYQTTGETAKRGTGVAPDTGGGWINGRGDETMTMLQGYAHIVHFFTALPWWTADPHDELVTGGAFCLADPGRLYMIYLAHGGEVTATLGEGRYAAKWFNPRSGKYADLPPVEGPKWTSPAATDKEDWVLLLQKPAPPERK